MVRRAMFGETCFTSRQTWPGYGPGLWPELKVWLGLFLKHFRCCGMKKEEILEDR